MSPSQSADSSTRRCFPRVSGDEPLTAAMPPAMVEFSPRERG